MPLRLNVGVSKKVGLPGYGSLGASCHVEVELDQSLVFDDLEGFQRRVKHAYVACRQAVQDELTRADTTRNGREAPEPTATSSATDPQPNGGVSPSNSHGASQKQIDYIHQLAGQIKGLGVRKLDTLAQKMFAKPLAGFSNLDASGLIDVLKEIKAGKIDLATALDGAAA